MEISFDLFYDPKKIADLVLDLMTYNLKSPLQILLQECMHTILTLTLRDRLLLQLKMSQKQMNTHLYVQSTVLDNPLHSLSQSSVIKQVLSVLWVNELYQNLNIGEN